MSLPKVIQTLLNEGLMQMHQHPMHHFDWRIRNQIYQQLIDHHGVNGKNTYRWIAVLAAEKVLPIFLSQIEDDPLPSQLVSAARDVVDGSHSHRTQELDLLEDDGYVATGISCLSWRSKIAYNAEYAGNACYKSLVEARLGSNLLKDTDNLIRGKTVQGWYLRDQNGADEVTDKEIAHLAAFSDTASSAAIAFASSVASFELDPHRLEKFWEWWATHAMPDAWRQSSSMN